MCNISVIMWFKCIHDCKLKIKLKFGWNWPLQQCKTRIKYDVWKGAWRTHTRGSWHHPRSLFWGTLSWSILLYDSISLLWCIVVGPFLPIISMYVYILWDSEKIPCLKRSMAYSYPWLMASPQIHYRGTLSWSNLKMTDWDGRLTLPPFLLYIPVQLVSTSVLLVPLRRTS